MLSSASIAAELLQGPIDEIFRLRGFGSGKVGVDCQRLRAGGPHRLCCLVEIDAVARDQDQG